jgi:hypothetical protein
MRKGRCRVWGQEVEEVKDVEEVKEWEANLVLMLHNPEARI